MTGPLADLLGDILSVTKLGDTTIAHAELVPPWALFVDPLAEAHIHIVQRGTCWLRTTVDPDPIRLDAGDTVLIRHGVGHALYDDPKTPPAPYRDVLAAMPARLAALAPSRAHETTIVFCAKYLFQHTDAHPLTALLPPWLHLPASADRPFHHLIALLRHETLETQAGTTLVVPRLVETLLVYVVRAWLDGQPLDASGWFGALREPAITKALSLIHQRPHAPWTVDELAHQVGQSRATFARRFTALVGEPPIAYLTRWRMCLAAKLLHDTDLTLEEIAERLDYESAASFSKAFRKTHACSPGAFRLALRTRSR